MLPFVIVVLPFNSEHTSLLNLNLGTRLFALSRHNRENDLFFLADYIIPKTNCHLLHRSVYFFLKSDSAVIDGQYLDEPDIMKEIIDGTDLDF